MANLTNQQLQNKIQDYISNTGKITGSEVKELFQDLTDTLFHQINNIPSSGYTGDIDGGNAFSDFDDEIDGGNAFNI